ncbi:unnamed protein product [Caenorhabditis angaria]|uniref:Coiled-coil domain-containing protein 86 n=1 Tax=Caenorhabditis angaria TaxID=860376 RepID=A0A9P1IA13_9PELO|nr:unnamed protein product [Caenorhabditis angaria]
MVARLLDEDQKQNLIKEERERRRIARLRQVRQQSAVHAKVIREIVSQKKSEIIEDVRAELHQEVSAQIEIIVRTPRGSKVAKRKSMSENAKKKIARRRPLTSQDLKLANQRNVEALRKLKESKNQEKREKLEKIERRKEAAKVANNILKQQGK